MLTIRFSRVGKKKAPVYRIVVMPKHKDPWANSTEILGHYDPRKTPKEFVIKADRVKHWMDQGAQPSDSVWNLLVEHKVIEGEKRTSTHISKKRGTKLETKATEAKAKEVEAAAKAKEAAEAAEAKKKEEAEAAAQAKAEAEAAPVAEPEVVTEPETPAAPEATTETPEATPEEQPAQ